MPVALVAASAAAAIIHFALGPEHLQELGWLGAGFYVAGVLQLGWAVVACISARGRNVVIAAGIAINGTILFAWLIARTVGLPAGDHPWTPEAIGLTDSITAALEAGVIVDLVRRSRRPQSAVPAQAARRRESDYPAAVGAAPVLGLIVIATVMALGAPHTHSEAVHDQPVGETLAGQAHLH